MINKKSQDHKRKEQNNTEWLDELINKIESMKNKISNIFNPSFFFFFKFGSLGYLLKYLESHANWNLLEIIFI